MIVQIDIQLALSYCVYVKSRTKVQLLSTPFYRFRENLVAQKDSVTANLSMIQLDRY